MILRKFKIYLLIPCLTIVVWLIYALFHPKVQFYTLDQVSDLTWMWYAGKQVFIDASKLYAYNPLCNTYYLPAFSVFAGIFLSPFPLIVAHYIMAIVNVTLGILFVLELNKIYKHFGIQKIWKRFIFLMISVLNWMVYAQFYGPQSKMLVGFIFIFVIRLQLEKKILSTRKGYIHYFLLVFALSVTPYFIFIVLILLVDDVGLKNIFKLKSLKKYIILIMFFGIQNFLYLVYPNLIFEGLLRKGILYGLTRGINVFWLMDNTYQFVNIYISAFLLINFAFWSQRIIFSKMKMEVKLAMFGLIYMWCGGFGWSEEFIPMTLLLFLFIPFMKKAGSIREMLFKHKLPSLCLIIIFIINMLPVNVDMYYKYIPFLINQPFLTIIIFRYLILFSLLTIFIIIIFKDRILFRLITIKNKIIGIYKFKRTTRGTGLLESYLSKKRAKVALELIDEYNDKNNQILDIGCGSIPDFLMSTDFKEKVAIDKELRNDGYCVLHNMKLIKDDIINIDNAVNLPYDYGKFNVVTLLAVIEHLTSEQVSALLISCYELLDHNGILIITTPTKRSDKLLKFMAKLNLVSSEEINEHKHTYTTKELKDLLLKIGFTSESIKTGHFEFFLNLWVCAKKGG